MSNAHLIAVAPELLEALEQYVEANPAFRLKPVGAPGSSARKAQDIHIALEDAALAAIAKATNAKTR